MLKLPGTGGIGGTGGSAWSGSAVPGTEGNTGAVSWPVFPDGEPSKSIAEAAPELIPDYDGRDIIELNGNRPGFTKYDRENFSGEAYAELDGLGRCGGAMARLHWSMMPENARGQIGEIRPSGWRQKKYPGIIGSEPPFLYHRCHLIAYALTGQNANARNLVTGTEHLNIELMRPLEIRVARVLDDSDGHVLYRATPYFKDRELVARGVELEALSLEDRGIDVCFHVFLYNVQPGIGIDYATGESRALYPSTREETGNSK